MASRTKNATRNIFFGFINKIILIICPFLTRTALIKVLGVRYLGINSLIVSILQVLNLSELGIGSALVYNMYKPIAENNRESVVKYLNFYKKCYKIIGLIVLSIGIIILPFLKTFIKGDIPTEINIYIVYVIYLINSVISYLFFSYRQSIIIASQRNDLISKLNTIIAIFQSIFQIISLVVFKSYYLNIIMLPIFMIINNIMILIITNKHFPEYKPEGSLNKKELLVIKKNVGGMIFQKLGGIVLTNVDNIVISAFLGIGILGVYNNYYYIIASLTMCFTVFIESIKPGVGNSIIKESLEKNYNNFKMFNFMYNWIVCWCSIGYLCLVQNFITFWIGSSYLLDKGIVIVFSVYIFVHHWCDMLYVYQESKGLWWENRFVQLYGAILNLVLNLFLVNIIGLYGILLSTIISVVFILDIGYFKILFKYYFDKDKWRKNYILDQIKYLIVSVIVGIITYLICINFDNSFFSLILRGFIVLIIPNVLMLFIYRNNDNFLEAKDFINRNFIKKLGGKNGKN